MRRPFGRKVMTWSLRLGALLLAPSAALAQSGSESTVGYIDSAIPWTQIRIRYDSAYDNNRPSRAEFFYPKSGKFGLPPFSDPRARGPVEPESRIDYQDANLYLEWAANERASLFLESALRWLNPVSNPNYYGYSDIITGFKYALIADADRYVTFQLRTFIPTGDASRGLGTGHVSLEPGILYFQRLTDTIVFEAEFRDWIPIGGSDFSGNVIRYGVGLGVTVHEGPRCRVTPVTELVGWTVLSGKESVAPFPATENAAGDTIINLKTGVRLTFDDSRDIYVGYGRGLTGDVWYRDILRVEYRRRF